MNFQSGAAIDIRSDEEKAKDFKFEELVASAAPVNWVEKSLDECRKFPIFNQDGSGSCVAQTEAKELGIMQWLKDGQYVHFSAADIYQRRVNKSGSGMGAIDARSIVAAGVTLEVLAPSQNMSDSQMDAVVVEDYKRQVGAVFAVPNYIEDPAKDIETIASIIQTTKKGVMVWFFFKIDEWTDRPTVIYPDLTLEAGLKHSVTAVDFCLVNGKKCLVIDDSWGTNYGQAGRRIIDEDFFKARNWYASHLVTFKFDLLDLKPHHAFSINLNPGDNNADVTALQDCLKFEGVFPTNVQSTGLFGPVTIKAVKAFQALYGIEQAGIVGPATRKKLNEIYGA